MPFLMLLRRMVGVAFLLLLAGLLIFNRTFATIGFPPIYISELVLAFALLAALFDFKAVFIAPLKNSRAMQLAALFMLYGIVRICFDARARGLEAARDGVICLYAVAAFLGPWLLSGFSARAEGRAALRNLLGILYIALPLAFGWAYGILRGWIAAPSDVKVDFLNLSMALTACVMGFQAYALCKTHPAVSRSRALFGAAGMLLAMLALRLIYRFPTRALWPAPFLCVATAVMAIGIKHRYKGAAFWSGVLALVVILAMAIASLSDARERLRAALDMDESHFQTIEGQRAAHSVKWRLVFWRRCIEQTAERAPVFGLGFGTNLTELLRDTPEWPMFEDSQNAEKYGAPNRHPHSAHVTIFARLGIFGEVLWIAILCRVFAQGLKNCWRARDLAINAASSYERNTLEDQFWNETMLLALWSIYLLAMSFGVVLENPFGGIWFWTLTGMIANRGTLTVTPATTIPRDDASLRISPSIAPR